MTAKVLELSAGFVAVVDSGLYRKLSKYSWHVHTSRGNSRKPGQPYARATVRGRKVYLHRMVAELMQGEIEAGYQVDHMNHCTLDNRWVNLEVVEPAENMKRRRKR